MNWLTLKWTAMKIEFHWWCIRRLRASQAASSSNRVKLHHYQAEQLRDFYEIQAGIRDFDHQVIAAHDQ